MPLPSLADIIQAAEAFIRPSNLGRLALCEGAALMSAAAVALDGEAPAAPEADLGTKAHAIVGDAVAAWANASGSEPWEADWAPFAESAVARATAEGLDGWTVGCIRIVMQLYRESILAWGISPENVMSEQALDMASTGMARKGTADLVLVRPGELVVILDLKAGFVDQGDACDHDQLACYAAAAALTYDAPKVVVGLVQPRAERGRRIDFSEFDAEAIRGASRWIRYVCAEARKPTADLVPGFQQCATCPALRRCEAAKEFLMQAIEGIASMTEAASADEWGEAIGAAKLAEKWAEKIKEAGKAHLIAGGAATGFKLGAPRAVRFVTDPAGAHAVLRSRGLEAEFMAAASVAVGKLPPQAVEAIGAYIGERLSDPPLVADKRAMEAS